MARLAHGASVYDDQPSPGWVKLAAPDEHGLSIICELGENAPNITQGYGGWEEIERSGRTALTFWKGYQPIGIDVELWVDNFRAGTSIEPVLTILEAQAGRGKKRRRSEPYELIVDTAGVMPHDYHSDPTNRWVIQNIVTDPETVIVNTYGNWVRAGVTVSLLQFVTDKGLAFQTRNARKRIQAKKPSSNKRYTVHSGDTVMSIARSKLGDAGRWREIADLNKIRDPRASLKTGSHLRLP